MSLLLATQRPDSKSLPTGISANATVRCCLKVMGQIENDMVLGTGSYKRGIRANMLAWADKGICYLVGEGADARIVRSVYVDAPAADTLAQRAYTLRKNAGLLSGHALGEEPPKDPAASYDLLADILAVVPAKDAKAWNDATVDKLAELRPEVYGPWGRWSRPTRPGSSPARSSRTGSAPGRSAGGSRARPSTGPASSGPTSPQRLRSVTVSGPRADDQGSLALEARPSSARDPASTPLRT